jgi:glycosyltransferase involved in cell wall biosynthesis
MLEINSLPTVAILLPTYNGEAFLEEQLESILRQEKVFTKVYIRDDASTDSTVQILKKYTEKFEIVFSEANIGTSASLLKLLHLAKNYDYVAFCDQDDIWASDHLSQGVQNLMKTRVENSVFYFPLYNYIDSASNLIGKRMPVERVGPSNALVENPIIGCGLIFNKTAAERIKKFDLSSNYFLDHQIYFLATLIGEIHQGSIPTVNYRIHKGNQVGISSGALDSHKNVTRFFYKLNQIKVQQFALKKIFDQVSEVISDESLILLTRHFRAIHSQSLIVRLQYLFHPQFHRQKRLDQIAFRLIFVMLLLVRWAV